MDTPKRQNVLVKKVKQLETEVEKERRDYEALGVAAIEEFEAILHRYRNVSGLDLIRRAVADTKAAAQAERDRLRKIKAAIDKAAKR